MARNAFGGSVSDYVVSFYTLGSSKLAAFTAATLTFFDAETGGNQVTDLALNADGSSPVTQVNVPATGDVPTFYGPDGVTQLWVSANGSASRVKMVSLEAAAAAVTGAQAAASEAAGHATDAASSASDAAAAAATATAPTDTTMASKINTAGSATRVALDAAYVPQSGRAVVNFAGAQTSEWLKIVNSSNNTTFHLIAAAGFSGPELLGLGVNTDNAKGLVSDVTNPGAMGAQISLFSGDSATSYGLDLNAQAGSLGTLMSVNTFGATGLAFDLHAQGTPAAGQVLAKWRTDALAGRGYWGSTLMQLFADTGNLEFTGPLVRANGAQFSVMTADLSKTGNMDRIDLMAGNTGTPYMALRKYSGTAGKFFSQRINPTGAAGATLDASTGAAAPGSEGGWVTALKWGMSSSLATLGFYGATPVTQQVLATGASHTVDDVITALQTLGLVKQA